MRRAVAAFAALLFLGWLTRGFALAGVLPFLVPLTVAFVAVAVIAARRTAQTAPTATITED
jgi:asparagine N-glycosylation enzyme membrane subunit Stt3